MKFITTALLFILLCFPSEAQKDYKTYANPINLDYTYMIYNAHNNLSYRSGADPAVVKFRGEYYMFVTRSMGYWHSTDLNNWQFIKPEKWYFEGSNAPAAHNYRDSVLYVLGNPSGQSSVLYTDNPKKGDWKATPSILTQLQDPNLYIDDDGQAYMFWGSSNRWPIRGKTLDMNNTFKPGETHDLFNLNPEENGWEQFGENHSDTLPGYIEGPWMTKHNGKYYLQYGAPGTEFNVYGDGAYIADNPLGPYKYMPNNPFSYKPGGFINGMGHGSTVKGENDSYWHFSTMAVAVTVGWERRIGMFQTFFDKNGLMHSDTYFGDYPHFVPASAEKPGEFSGWMLLSYKKPVKVSSYIAGHGAENIVDESVQSFWLAENNDDTQWIEIDLENEVEIRSIQINYHDYESDMYGRYPDLKHQYTIEVSKDGQNWEILIDKSDNTKDVPNDYVELDHPVKTRYVKFNSLHVPTPHLSISGLRVFGKGMGKAPQAVKEFTVDRKEDRRDAHLNWNPVKEAQGYNVFWGIAPDKLYNTWLVYDKAELELKNLSKSQTYYFAIEAFNENGVGKRSKPIRIE